MQRKIRYEDDPDIKQVINEFKLYQDESKADRLLLNPTVDPELTIFDKIRVRTIQ